MVHSAACQFIHTTSIHVFAYLLCLLQQYGMSAATNELRVPVVCPLVNPSGHPKGVMLSHGNLMSQISNFDYFLKVGAVGAC